MSQGWKVLYVGRGRLDGTHGTLMFSKNLSEPVTREHAEMAVRRGPVPDRAPDAFGRGCVPVPAPAWRIKTTARPAGRIPHLPVFASDIPDQGRDGARRPRPRPRPRNLFVVGPPQEYGPAPAQEPPRPLLPLRPRPRPQNAPAQSQAPPRPLPGRSAPRRSGARPRTGLQ